MSRRLAIVLAVLCLGCRSEEPWTFGMSRAFYEDGAIANVDPTEACAAAVLLALPIVLDVVFLPVALPRDLVVHGTPGG